MITVAKDGTGDFTSVNDAVKSIPNGNETIFIKNGIYKERVEITANNVTLIGENANDTVITEGFYALMPMEDGSKRGTFRSYTFLFMLITSAHTILHLKIHQALDKMSDKLLLCMLRVTILFSKIVAC